MMEAWAIPTTGTVPLADRGLESVPPFAPPTTNHFKRSYQACMDCRRRKVKCDLGNPDAPSQPPCARCKREQRECVFGGPRASTKKAKPSQGDRLQEQRYATSGQISSRKTYDPLSNSHVPPRTCVSNLCENGRPSSSSPFRSSAFYSDPRDYSREGGGIDDLADPLLTSHVHGINDAMNLLFRAAEKLKDMHDLPSPIRVDAESNQLGSLHYKVEIGEFERTIMDASGQVKKRRVIPTSCPESAGTSPPSSIPPSRDSSYKSPTLKPVQWIFEGYPGEKLSVALEAWRNFKLVHQGWLSPLECFTFVNFFHKTLICHSPVLDNYFALPSTQLELIADEPVLAMTILTIAARYCPLPGHGGVSRSHYLHERFCSYAQGLIGRVFWGQARTGSSGGEAAGKPGREKGIRGLGTVESLLLWSDWHPRGIHFPPIMGDDGVTGEGWDVTLVVEDESEDIASERGSFSNRWKEEVMEPTRRSDRLSWMLLGAAFTLAHELGIFDSAATTTPGNEEKPTTSARHCTSPTSTPDQSPLAQAKTASSPQSARRIARLRKLCYIYLHTLSTRLNWTSILDDNWRLYRMTESSTSATYQGPHTSMYEGKWHRVMSNWIELTRLTKTATDVLFSSKKHTQDLLQENKHLGHLKHLNAALKQREDELLKLNEQIGQGDGNPDTGHQNAETNEMEIRGLIVPKPFWKHIRIEFFYLKVFINSIALEAVAERYWRRAVNREQAGKTNGLPSVGNTQDTDFDEERDRKEWEYVVVAFEGGMEILRILLEGCNCDNLAYNGKMRATREAPDSTTERKRKNRTEREQCEGCNQTDVHDYWRDHWLRYAPVRIFVRLIYAAIFLMKATTVIGPHAKKSIMCYALLQKVILALRSSAVDDVHMANNFAELLEAHLATLVARGRRILQAKDRRHQVPSQAHDLPGRNIVVPRSIPDQGDGATKGIKIMFPETPKPVRNEKLRNTAPDPPIPVADGCSGNEGAVLNTASESSPHGESVSSGHQPMVTQRNTNSEEAASVQYSSYSLLITSVYPHAGTLSLPQQCPTSSAGQSTSPQQSLALMPEYFRSPVLCTNTSNIESTFQPLASYDSPAESQLRNPFQQLDPDGSLVALWNSGFLHPGNEPLSGTTASEVCQSQRAAEEQVPGVFPEDVGDPGVWDVLWNFNMVG